MSKRVKKVEVLKCPLCFQPKGQCYSACYETWVNPVDGLKLDSRTLLPEVNYKD